MNNNNESGNGAIAGIVIIIIVLLAGAVYFVGQRTVKTESLENATSTQNVGSTSQADDINSLENDAANMNFDNLGQGVNQLQ